MVSGCCQGFVLDGDEDGAYRLGVVVGHCEDVPRGQVRRYEMIISD